MDEREAYISLNMMERVGPVVVRSLVEVLGSAAAVFEADEEALLRANGVGRELAGAIARQRDSIDCQAELERAARCGARMVTPLDEEYPAPLREIYDPPLALYVRGELLRRDRHAVAVVGTRRPTHYGRSVAEQFSMQLATAGMTIASGLAMGIDTVAHQGALKVKGRTIAVLGSALDCLYPRENAGLATRIAEQGAVVSEFPFGRKPDKTTFPMRNRIVSGLSMGVLVVEAGAKSGARITADQALEQGRSVFAVPGRIDSPASAGTNDLIKRGARPATCVEDVLQEFECLFRPSELTGGGHQRVELAPDEQQVVDLLAEGEKNIDELIRGAGLNPARAGALVIGLEMKKVVRTLPGRIVELCSKGG